MQDGCKPAGRYKTGGLGPPMELHRLSDMQGFDFETMSQGDRYRIVASTVVPRPIAWVTTQSADGVVNAAPFSFFNVFGDDPVVVGLGLLQRGGGAFKDTAANILDRQEFVIQLVPERLVAAMNATCIDAPPGISEIELVGLHTTPSVKIAPPRITESPVAFECRVLHAIPNGAHQVIVLGQVLHAHIGRAYLTGDPARPRIDTPALGLVGRMHGRGVYARTDSTFEIDRPAAWTTPG